MKFIEKIINQLSLLLAWLSAICITLMMVHVFADVLLKYLINMPIYGTAEVVAEYYMLACVFLPLPLVELRNSGVSVTLFYDMLRNKSVKRVILLFALLGQILFFALLAYQSGLDAMGAFHKREIVEGQITLYVWPGYFFLPLGLWVAALVSIFRFFQVILIPDWEQIVE